MATKTKTKTKTKKSDKTLRIQQVKSPIGCPSGQRDVLRSLGLRRIRHVVERPDTAAVRGMVNKIPHLVQILED
jgi:large subunit ribosomal protein L30